MELYFSFIIPVYNRPEEIDELLHSFTQLQYDKDFEVVIVEDGSSIPSDKILEKYKDNLQISYYAKENTGPGDSRNYGMQKAGGNYFLVLDSDVILPPDYLQEVTRALQANIVHCFGGPDDAHQNFSDLQKAINYSMTSYLTTGGIRGRISNVNKFQPRSFNMGISKKAFQQSGGFGQIHPGEDPDLTIRLWNLGFDTMLIPNAKVYHKRRISWKKFYQQVTKFGLVRPILNKWHPETAKITYWFPSIFIIFFFFALLAALFITKIPLYFYATYFIILWSGATIRYSSFKIGVFSVIATIIQFYGYGRGFLISFFHIHLLKKDPRQKFQNLFFSK